MVYRKLEMERRARTFLKDVTVKTTPKQESKSQHLKTHENLKKKKKLRIHLIKV